MTSFDRRNLNIDDKLYNIRETHINLYNVWIIRLLLSVQRWGGLLDYTTLHSVVKHYKFVVMLCLCVVVHFIDQPTI